MNRTAAAQMIVFCLCSIGVPCSGQAASQAPPPATMTPPTVIRYAGCVQRSATDKDTIVLSSETLLRKADRHFFRREDRGARGGLERRPNGQDCVNTRDNPCRIDRLYREELF